MWEVYQLLQKVALIGLLTFVDRGSILQCLAGLAICNLVLVAMVKDRPYLDEKTNVLSIVGQLIVVLSFLSALLMCVDLEGEAFTVDMVGFVILAANVPMMLYLIYDTWFTMQEEIHAAQLDMIAAELGGPGAKYKCLRDVDITKKLRTENEEMSRQRLSLQEELKDLKNKVENTRSEMEFKNMKLKKAEEREQQIQEKNQRREIDYAKVLKNMEAKMSYVIENLTVRLGPTLTLTLPHRLTSALQKTYRPNEMTRPREGPIRELGGKCTPRSPRSRGVYTSIPPVGGHTFCPRASRCLIDFPAKNVTVEFYNACCAGVLPDGRRPLRV
jgi:hypothetical protein